MAVDPLAAVLGPEHPGRTRGVGHNVGLRVGLGLENKRRKHNPKEKDCHEQINKLQQQVDGLLDLLSTKDAIPAESPGVNKSSVGSIAYDPQIESMQVSCKLHMFTFLEV